MMPCRKSGFIVTKRMRAGMPMERSNAISSVLLVWQSPMPARSTAMAGVPVLSAMQPNGMARRCRKQATAFSRGVALSEVSLVASRRIFGWSNCSRAVSASQRPLLSAVLSVPSQELPPLGPKPLSLSTGPAAIFRG